MRQLLTATKGPPMTKTTAKTVSKTTAKPKSQPKAKATKPAPEATKDPRDLITWTVLDILAASFDMGRKPVDGVYFSCGVCDYDSRHGRYPADITMYTGKPGKGKPVGTVRINLKKDYSIGSAALRKAASEIAGISTIAAARAKPKAAKKAKARKTC